MIRPGASLGKATARSVVVVGNTHTTVRRFEAGAFGPVEGWPTADLLSGRQALPELPDPVVLVAVVPDAAARWRARYPDLVAVGLEGSPLAVAARGLGADRLAGAIAAVHLVGPPAIAVDAGTATTVTVVDAAGTVRGGAILPGLTTAAEALGARTAQLPVVAPGPVVAPWGEDTEQAIRLGLVAGQVGAVRELVARAAAGMGLAPAAIPVLITGGWGELLAAELGYRLEPDLVALGAVLYAEAGGPPR